MNDGFEIFSDSALPIQQRRFDVFISHVPADEQVAKILAKAIEARGYSVANPADIRGGLRDEEVALALQASGAIIVLLSAASLSSEVIVREFEQASMAFPRHGIFPIAVGDVDVHAMPKWLANYKWLHFRDGFRVDRVVDELIHRLDFAIGGRGSDDGSLVVYGELPPRMPLVGIDDYLHQLRSQTNGFTWIIGKAGVGKSSLAREYIHQMRNELGFVFWLRPPLGPASYILDQLQSVGNRESLGSGLIVVDELNASSLESILHVLTDLARRHQVIVTSQKISAIRSLIDDTPNILTLSPLSEADIASYLDMVMPQLPSRQRAELANIKDEASRSALALRLVTRALKMRSLDEIMSASSKGSGGIIGASVRILLESLSPDHRRRLEVLSFCRDFLGVVRTSTKWDMPGDASLFALLSDWGACLTEPDGAVALRKPVVDVLQAQLTREGYAAAAEYMAPRLPDPNDPEAQNYLTAVSEVAGYSDATFGPKIACDFAELLIWQASTWLAVGEPDRAESLGPRAVSMAEASGQVLLKVRALNLQSALAFYGGRIEKAGAIELRTAELAASELGPDHPIAISALANLATTRRAQGDLAEAITLLRRAVSLGQKVLPKNHPDNETALINLAVCLRDAGLHVEAISALDSLGANVSGARIKQLANQVRAGVLMNMEKPDEAAKLLIETLNGMESLGLSSVTEALTARSNLATIYAKIGRLDEAVELQGEVVEKLEVNSGPDHPVTLAARNKYAKLLDEQGSNLSAYQLWSEVAAARARVLGDEHPDTFESWLRVAAAASAQGDSANALKLYEELLERGVRLLGPENPMSLRVREQWARELGRSGAVEKSRRAYKELLADLERSLPSNHPMVLRVAAVAGKNQ